MLSRIGSCAVLAFALAGLSDTPAQSSGLQIAALTRFGDLLMIQATGRATTVLAAPAGPLTVGLDVTPTLTNRGFAVLYYFPQRASTPFVVLEYSGGQATTLTALPGTASPFQGVAGSIESDQDGDYIVTIGSGVYRVGPSASVATIFAAASTHLDGACERLARGGWLVEGSGTLLSVSRSGVATSLAPVPGAAAYTDLSTDTRTGNAHYVAASLWRYDESPGRFASVTASPPNLDFTCVEIEPRSQDLLVGTLWGRIFRMTRSGAILNTVFAPGPSPPLDLAGLAVAGSREVGGITPARAGSTYAVRVSFPGQPGGSYALGCSFGFHPGIPAGNGGTVPLVADALFFLSQANPHLFTGFAGALSARGEAVARIVIPASTTGIRFYVAAIVHGSGRVLAISEPLGVTVG